MSGAEIVLSLYLACGCWFFLALMMKAANEEVFARYSAPVGAIGTIILACLCVAAWPAMLIYRALYR